MPPPFNIDNTSPNPNSVISAYPANEQANRTTIEEWLTWLSDPNTGLLEAQAIPPGFGASTVLYENHNDQSLSTASSGIIMPDLEGTGFREYVIQAYISSITTSGQSLANFLIDVGDASTFAGTPLIAAQWTSNVNQPRYVLSHIVNLTDAEMPIWGYNITTPSGSPLSIPYASYSSRPISRLRARLSAIGGSPTAIISDLKVIGVR